MYTCDMGMPLHIRDIRKERGYTLAELADKIGVSVPHLSGVERGVKNVNNHLLERLSLALRVPPEQLISGVDVSGLRRLSDAMAKLSPEDQERVEAFAEALAASRTSLRQT